MLKKLLPLVLLMLCLTPAALGETIAMTFVGDCTLGCDIGWFKDERAFPNVIEQEGADYPFALVRDLFAQDDLTVVNLEGVLADTDEGRRAGRKYNFRGSTAYAQILRDASVELATLGNNHAYDFGQPGIASTKAALTGAGVGYTINDEPYIYEKNGVRIGVLSYNSNVYEDNLKQLPEIIRALREDQGCAAVVLCLHAGVEYDEKHSSGQRRYAERAISAGVDLVIGHHPHVLQGLDVYQNRNIVYSLGNFCFGGNRRIHSEQVQTMAVRVEMAFEDGVYSGQRLTVFPAINTGTLDRNNYQPYLAEGEQAQEIMQQLQRDTSYTLAPYAQGEGAVQQWLRAQQPSEP